MTIGAWDPGAATDTPIDINATLLDQLITYARDGKLEQLATALPPDEQQRLAPLMQTDPSRWLDIAQPLQDEQIVHLVRFFAMAENLPGWEAGANSPVIPLAKVLRQRGKRLDKSLLQWLRDTNDNRFLPYGPL